MAYRVLGRSGPAQPRRARRLLFAFTLSLSCSALCYSLLCCCAAPGPGRLLAAPRCPRRPAAPGPKLLPKSRPCAPPGPPPSAPRPPAANHSGAPKPGAKRLPQALIVGVKKGGTRAVLEFIRVHPDVRALGTEPHFFDRNYGRGLDWYRINKSSQCTGQVHPALPLTTRSGTAVPAGPSTCAACEVKPAWHLTTLLAVC